jgi:type IV secretion system protein VirB4
MDDVASGRGLMGDHHFSVAVHVDGLAELPIAARRMNALLVNCGLSVAPERWGCEPAVFAQVPGSPAWAKARHGSISGYNFASFSSLSGEPEGGGRGRWGAPVLRLRTATGAAHDLHLHVNGVGHFLCFGPSGFGKTVLLGLVGAHLEPLVAHRGGLVCFLDADGSNELTVRACGGPYSVIRRGVDSGMAPWKALADTPENRAWLVEFTLGLITSDGGSLPSPQQQDAIKFGVRFLMRQRPALRSFAALRQFLEWKESGAGDRLGRWCKGGALGWAFDGDEDVLRFDAHMAGIDNSALLVDDAAVVREPMAAYQFHRIGERVGTGVPGAVLVDEAQAYLPGERYAAGFERFVTRLRKGNGLVGMAMQQPQAILGHRIGQSFVSNALTKLLFANASAEIAAYRDGLHCTEGELAAVREGMAQHGRGTFLVKRDAGSFIARADLSALPDHIAVLSADPNRRALARRIMEEVGPEPERWVPEYRRRHKEAEA